MANPKLPDGVQIPEICIFLHVPRTGGTTVRLVAEANLPEGQILPIYGPDIEHPEQVIQRLHEPTRMALKMVRGHISFGIHMHLPWAKCYYFTLVRNPVHRVWSLWNYAYRHKTHHLYEALHNLETIGNAVEAGVSAEFNNGMCRQLSGLDGPFPQEPYGETKIPYGCGMGNETAFAEVMARVDLKQISLGTTEYFDAFLYVLAETMGWKNRAHTKANAGPPFQQDSLSERDVQIINAYNQHDKALWEFAKSMCD